MPGPGPRKTKNKDRIYRHLQSALVVNHRFTNKSVFVYFYVFCWLAFWSCVVPGIKLISLASPGPPRLNVMAGRLQAMPIDTVPAGTSPATLQLFPSYSGQPRTTCEFAAGNPAVLTLLEKFQEMLRGAPCQMLEALLKLFSWL